MGSNTSKQQLKEVLTKIDILEKKWSKLIVKIYIEKDPIKKRKLSSELDKLHVKISSLLFERENAVRSYLGLSILSYREYVEWVQQPSITYTPIPVNFKSK